MDLRHLFIPEPPLTALAISHNAAVLLSLKKTSKGIKREFIQRQILPLGTIAKGELKNEKEFIKAVQACFDAVSKKYIKKYPNIIAAIPDDPVYAAALDFPDALETDELDDALKMNAPIKLPYSLEATYHDKELLIPVKNGRQEFLFAQIPKKIADAYLAALEKIGLTAVVLGYANASVLRTLKFADDNPIIVIRNCENGWQISCVAKKQARILSRVPNSLDFKTPKYEIVSKAIENLLYYAETEFGLMPKKALYIGGNKALSAKTSLAIEKDLKSKGFDISFLPLKESIKPEILNLEKEENLSDLLPAYGLGLRSVISRDEDTMISLLPVGTEEAYKVKRNIVYARTLAFTISTVAIS
ncbi:MAG TPA: pilus assembly protein PilM, partial [Patescibacteria group bacterium]|nr:pilus assembly protein PilM [Patescibacteria group bacterium]